MIGAIKARSPSLLELFRRAKLADQARQGKQLTDVTDNQQSGAEIVSRRDERGMPYPGDFPNDLSRFYRGCF
jgi:hypothetical protein